MTKEEQIAYLREVVSETNVRLAVEGFHAGMRQFDENTIQKMRELMQETQCPLIALMMSGFIIAVDAWRMNEEFKAVAASN